MATHTIVLRLEYTMRDMDGTLEQSAEIAHEQITYALWGGKCQYGLPDITPENIKSLYEYNRGDA